MSRKFKAFAATAALLSMPATALAHTGVGDTSGFAHGFAHPMLGLDHLLAMMLVGLLACQLGGRSRWLLPASFITVMVFAGIVGMQGWDAPFIEAGIALSIVGLGTMVATGKQMRTAASVSAVAFFALFHGYAHGAEMPETAGGLGYAAGFVLATAILHAAGFSIGMAIARVRTARAPQIARALGGIAALAGAGFLAGAL
jgi:urease accessory protein